MTSPLTTSPLTLVVDNGSLSVQQLSRRLHTLGAATETLNCTELPDRLPSRYQALVLSGTKVRAYDSDFYQRLAALVMESSVPVLGICGGMQIIGTAAGAQLVPGKQRVGGHDVHLDMAEPMFALAQPTVSLFQRHTLYLKEAPAGFSTVGWSEDAPVEFLRSDDGRIFGSQAHLEFRTAGLDILKGFIGVVEGRA